MRSLFFAFLLSLCSLGSCGDKFILSQDTGAIDAELDGPSSAIIGELVTLSATAVPYVGQPTWIVTTPIKRGGWKVFTSDDNKNRDTFVFSTSYPGKYCIVFSFCTLEDAKLDNIDKTKIKTESIIHWINIAGLDDIVVPDPKPDIIPTPNDKYGLISLSKTLLSNMSDKAKLKKDDVRGIFESISAQIAAGTIKEFNDIVLKTASGLKTKVTDSSDKAEWNKFLAEISKKLEVLDGEDKLNTMDNYKECWSDIAKGLK